MDPGHLSRLEMQLSSALGDDTGKKLRILQQAIQVRFESLTVHAAVLPEPKPSTLNPVPCT